MAEIVGLVASVVQLAGAGLKLSQALYQYADGVATADRRIKNIANEVKLTSLVIQELGDIFKQDETADLISENAVKTANETIKECSSVFTEIEVIINKSKPGKMGRLMLPFRDNKIELLRSQIDKLKSTLELLMQVLIHAHQVSSSKLNREAEAKQREEIKQLLENKKQSTKKYEESLRNFSISDSSTAVDDEDRSLQEEDPSSSSSNLFNAASAIGSTINPTTLATCVNHVRHLLANIENLQLALVKSVDGDDHSDHHQRAIGSYFVARSYLDSYLLGNPKVFIPETQLHLNTGISEARSFTSNDGQAVLIQGAARATSAAPTYFQPNSGVTFTSNQKTSDSTNITIPPIDTVPKGTQQAIVERRKIEEELKARQAAELAQKAKQKSGDKAEAKQTRLSAEGEERVRCELTEVKISRLQLKSERREAKEEDKHGPETSAGVQVQQPNNQCHSESTTNSKWRKRTKTGCITCRKHRIKCSEERPTCANCIRFKRQCEGYKQRVIFKPPIGDFSPGTSGTNGMQPRRETNQIDFDYEEHAWGIATSSKKRQGKKERVDEEPGRRSIRTESSSHIRTSAQQIVRVPSNYCELQFNSGSSTHGSVEQPSLTPAKTRKQEARIRSEILWQEELPRREATGTSNEDEEDNLPPPSFPALNSAQRAPKPSSDGQSSQWGQISLPSPTMSCGNIYADPNTFDLGLNFGDDAGALENFDFDSFLHVGNDEVDEVDELLREWTTVLG